jgi:hypothetical protein
MSVQHVHKWCREFKDGHTDVHDEQRSGRPSVSDETIAKSGRNNAERSKGDGSGALRDDP